MDIGHVPPEALVPVVLIFTFLILHTHAFDSFIVIVAIVLVLQQRIAETCRRHLVRLIVVEIRTCGEFCAVGYYGIDVLFTSGFMIRSR